VKLLLTDKQPVYTEESGLGLTVSDCAMLEALTIFHSHRASHDTTDNHLTPEMKGIYDHVMKILGKERKVVRSDEVMEITNVMMNEAAVQAKLETAKTGKRTFWNERSSEEEQEQPGMHDGSLEPSVAESLPEVPGVVLPKRACDKEAEEEKEAQDEEIDYTLKEVEAEEQEDVKKKDTKKKTGSNSPTSLKGFVICLSGTLSFKRADAIEAITKGGGKFVTTVTKACTHLLVADPDEETAKITKARDAGVEIVGEDFLANFL